MNNLSPYSQFLYLIIKTQHQKLLHNVLSMEIPRTPNDVLFIYSFTNPKDISKVSKQFHSVRQMKKKTDRLINEFRLINGPESGQTK